MNQVAYFGDLCRNRDRLRKQLENLFEIEFKPLESSLESRLGQYTVFDFDLNDTTHLLKLKDKLKSRPKDAKVIFVTEKASRLQDTRALAIGATDVIHRPFDGRALLAKLWGEVQSLADEKPEFADGSVGHLDLTLQVRMGWHEGFQIYGEFGSVIGKLLNLSFRLWFRCFKAFESFATDQ
jgi:CheY-like chemotaxis protein